MNLRIGDKVSFLNERGGGVVARFLTSDTAVVETEDGFEVPYPVKELVSKNYASAENVIVSPIVPMDKAVDAGKKAITLADGIFLCFLPNSLDDLSSAKFNVAIYNNTKWDIVFNLFGKNTQGHTILGSDRLLGGRSVSIDTIPTGYIDKYSGGVFQVLFYSGKIAEVKAPESLAFKVKAVKLVDKANYNTLSHFNSAAVAVSLYPKQHEGATEKDYELGDLQIKFGKDAARPRIQSKPQQVLEMEVDLHIEELIDDMRGLTNADMLLTQLAHARKKLDEAVQRSCRKVVFIHGVGNGKLRAEIRKLLDGYAGLEYFDASYAKYGVGATEVRLGNVRLA